MTRCVCRGDEYIVSGAVDKTVTAVDALHLADLEVLMLIPKELVANGTARSPLSHISN